MTQKILHPITTFDFIHTWTEEVHRCSNRPFLIVDLFSRTFVQEPYRTHILLLHSLRTMSFTATNAFLTVAGVGTGVPAVLLFAGFPDLVCQGPWRRTVVIRVDEDTGKLKFGLYAYSVSDICLSLLIGAHYLHPDRVSARLALGATAVHQFAYLAAAFPSRGFHKEYIGSIVFGALAAYWAFES